MKTIATRLGRWFGLLHRALTGRLTLMDRLRLRLTFRPVMGGASFDLRREVDAAVGLTIAARNATATGTEVDLQGYEGALVLVFTGTITDGTHAIDFEEADTTGGPYTDVAAADLLGTEPSIVAADDDKVFEFGYIGSKRFVRVSVAVTAGVTGGTYGALVVRGHKRHGT